MSKLFYIALCAIIFLSCNIGSVKKKETQTKKIEHKTQSFPKSITIYRFGIFSLSKAKRLQKNLEKYYPKVVLQQAVLMLPKKYYLKERNRYQGTGLFGLLGLIRRKNSNNEAVVGLTDYAIYKLNKISSTYGIMGVSQVGIYV